MNKIYKEIGSEERKTGSRSKNWNEAKWIEFIEELIQKDRAEQLILSSVVSSSCDCKKHGIKTGYGFEVCTKCGNEWDT
jgi:hypothetical protein